MKPTSLAAAALMLSAIAVGCQEASPSANPTTQQVELSEHKLDALPPAAKLAAEREAEGCLIKKVSKGEFEGRDLYTVEFTTADGSHGRLQALSDGRVLSKEVEQKKIAVNDLPPAVQLATSAHTGGVKPDSVLKAAWGDAEVYVVTAKLSGMVHQLTFDARGQLLKEQAEIEIMNVPVRARATLLERFPKLKITAASEIRIASAVFFEVTGDTEKNHLTITLLPDGTVKSIRAN